MLGIEHARTVQSVTAGTLYIAERGRPDVVPAFCFLINRTDMKPRHAAALALVGTFVIQACASAPATLPTSTSTAPLLCVQDADCFKQSMDANHVALPAGTTTEQAYAKYKNCLLVQNERIIGPFVLDASDFHIRQQNCFTNALQ